MEDAFAAGDRVIWTGSDGTKQVKAVVSAVDDLTKPPTYIIKCEDGRKKGATGKQLIRDGSFVPSTMDQVSETAAELAKNAKKTTSHAVKHIGKGFGHFRANISKKIWGKEGATPKDEDLSANNSSVNGSVNSSSAAAAAAAADARGGGGAGDATAFDEQVAMLVEMGYRANQAKSALLLADGDVDTAVALLSQEVAGGGADERNSGENSPTTQDSTATDSTSSGEGEGTGRATSGGGRAPHTTSQNPSFVSLMQGIDDAPAQPPHAPPPAHATAGVGAFDFLDGPSPTSQSGGSGTPVSHGGQSHTPSASSQSMASPVAHSDPFGGLLGGAAPAPPPPAAASRTPASAASPASAGDAFDFLDGPPAGGVAKATASPTPAAAAPTPAPAAGTPGALRATSPTPGRIKVVVNPGTLPSGPSAATHVSIGVKPKASPTWRHQVDCTAAKVVAFSECAPWEQVCLPVDQKTVAFSLGTVFKGHTEFMVCARVATPAGPGPACAPVTVAVDDASAVVGHDDLGSFFADAGSSPTQSPRPIPAQRKAWPTHRKGQIYDID